MKFYMFGKWQEGMKEEQPFEIFIGLSARTSEEALARLERLVADNSNQFILYDIVEEGE